ncbi:putative exporter protein, RND superfamily [Methanophagales archaeon]|nr:putative exporter protein, RND superfamily [Methanophagales archaeon]
MIQRLLNRWAEISKRYYLLIIVIALVIASTSFISAKETEIDTNYLGFFYPDTNYMEEIRFLQSEFPGTETAQILVKVDRIAAKTVLEDDILVMTEELIDAVSDLAGVKNVTSVLDLGSTKEGILSRPHEERKHYINNELRYSLITVKLDATEVPERTELVETLQKTIAKVNRVGGSTVTLTGGIAWGYAWDNAIRLGFRSSIIVGFIAIFILTFLLFKSPTTPFVIMIPVLVAVFASFGLMHFINIPLNFLTAMFGAVTLGLGVDYSIHLVHRYHEEIAHGNENALNKACMTIGRNTFFTSLTTMAAFSAMALSPIRMLGEYGLMSFIAISFSALCVFLFIPSLLILEERIGWGARTLDYSWFSHTLGTERLIPRLMTRVANYSLKRSLGAIIIIAITLIPIFAGVGMIKSESEQEMWMPEGDPLMVAWKVVDDEFSDYEYSTILVQSDDIRTSEMMGALERIEESVMCVPGVVKVTGLNNLLKEIPADKNTLEEQIAAIPKDKRDNFVTDDYTATLVIIKTDTGIDETLVQEIDDAILFVDTPDEATFKHASISALFSQMDRLMEESRAETTAISLILVFTILYIFFRSFVRILLAFAPVLFAIIYALGTMGLIGIPFTPLTVMIGTILIGIGTDYSVHFISRYREEKGKGYDTRDALHTTTLTVGVAIMTSTLTTMFGFLALTSMSLVPVQDFGIIAAIGLVYAAFFTPIIVSLGILVQERVTRSGKQLLGGLRARK